MNNFKSNNSRHYRKKLDEELRPEDLSLEAEKNNFHNYLKSRLYSKKSKKKYGVKLGKHVLKRGSTGNRTRKKPSVKKVLPPVKKKKNKIVMKRDRVLPVQFKRPSSSHKLKPLKKKEDWKIQLDKDENKTELERFIHKIRKNPNSLEFIYLNRSKESRSKISAFNPYDLVITTHKNINHEDYYTIGSKGVTHFSSGNAEFTPLETWLKDKRLFKEILNLPFFQKYRIFKSFYYMKNYVVTKKKNQCKKMLTNELYLLSPILSKPLKKVRDICLEIEQMRLFKDFTGQTLDVEEFKEMQRKQFKLCAEKLAVKIDKIVDLCSMACKISMKKIKSIETLKDLHDQADDVERGPTKLDDYSEAPERDHYRMTFTDLSQKKRVCKKLISFVRLVEFLIVDSLLNLNKKCIKEVLNKVHFLTENVHLSSEDGNDEDEQEKKEELPNDPLYEDERKKKVPMIFVEVELKRNTLVLNPPKEKFIDAFNFVIKGFLKVIQFKRLLKRNEFSEYMKFFPKRVKEEANTGFKNSLIYQFISREERIKVLNMEIMKSLNRSISRVVQYMKNFEDLKTIFFENEKENISLIADPKNLMPVKNYQNEMDRYTEQIEMMSKMRKTNVCGIFTILTKRLKEKFVPSPKNCLLDYHKYLEELAIRLNERIFKKLTDRIKVLSTSPNTVEEFVDYCQFLDETKKRMMILEDDFSIVAQLYEILDDLKVEVNETEKESFKVKTANKLSMLKTAVEIAEDSFDNRKTRFSHDITSQFNELKNRLSMIKKKGREKMIFQVNSNSERVIDHLQVLRDNINSIKKRSSELMNYKEMFNLTLKDVDDVEEICDDTGDDISLKLKLWTSLDKWGKLTSKWTKTKFKNIVSKELKSSINEYLEISVQCEKGLPNNVVVEKFSFLVDEWKTLYPVISNLKNEHFKNRHFRVLNNQIFKENLFSEELIKRDSKKKIDDDDDDDDDEKDDDKSFTLGYILGKKLLEKAAQIESISSKASNEANLEEMVKKVASQWERTPFNITTYKEYYILGDSEDIITQIEDDEIVLSMILSSPFVKPIKAKVEKWRHDLKLMYDIIQQWNKLQVKWLYLESVFSSGDTNMQEDLYEENAKFKEISKFFKDQMKKTNEQRNVHTACTQNMGLFEKFRSSNASVEYIEKKLEHYLDRKRNLFPRLYFLSNDDLLDILSRSKDPMAVQPHLEKCFDNIKSLKFASGGVEIISMISEEGEEVKFLSKNLRARGPIEEWLKYVEQNMISTLRHITKLGIKDFTSQQRNVWIRNHKCQVVLTVNQIFWVKEVERCLQSSDPISELKKYHKTCMKSLNDLAILSRQKLHPLVRHTIKTLIILEVHGATVVQNLIDEGITNRNDFGWLKQLRYYWDGEENNCLVKQSNSVFKYGFEYIGCKSRLVITPLTDRIYMTMTGALHLNMGGAPLGPAGTGKTETVKDLAKALGYQCVVYNCSDGVTYKMMYKFFSGIVQTGAWTCFDEFNRINIEVLSVIATQILTIQDALKRKLKRFEFEEGKEPILLKESCGLFITMNPGYSGRTELPDNLKALFRPVACMIPDYQIIAEVILYAEGYENAKTLSKKMVQLYKLSNEQLSPQTHYDFGMRAIKSVLVMAGELKRNVENEGELEEKTLMKAMRDANLPKFVKDDITLFEAIVSDLFPELELEDRMDKNLKNGIEICLKRNKLQVVPQFVKKVIQLYDTMIVRHGVMIVGPTCAGKTTARRILAQSLSYLRNEAKVDNDHFQNVITHVLNPKSITYSELYGKFNILTHEFLQGIIPYFAIKCNKNTSKDKKWIIFDGPVDTLWIESMNSVLDDSRILCLDNADTIRLNKTLHMLFEVEDLSVASPATVSRCGMVWMDSNNLGWDALLHSWIERLDSGIFLKEYKEFLKELFVEVIGGALEFIRKNCTEVIESNDVNLVQSLCDLFKILIESQKVDALKLSNTYIKQFFNNLFLFCITWSIGANISQQDRLKFDKYIINSMDKRIGRAFKLTVYDYYLDLDTNRFFEWSQLVPKYEYDPNVPFHQIMVPTEDTVVYKYFAEHLTSSGKPLLFVGETGTGKTSMIINSFSGKKNIDLVPIQFSAQTSSHRTKQAIENKLVSRKNVLKPRGGVNRVVLFIDDLNMPEPEEFGAQPPVELIRQVLQYSGFYDLEDRDNIHFKTIEGTSCVAACGIPGGGRHHISQRTTRMFHLFNIPLLSNESMRSIFQYILDGFLINGEFTDTIKNYSENFVKSAIELFKNVKGTFRPTPNCPHYTFNLRDLSKVFQGIVQVKSDGFKEKESFFKLYFHESMRCYYDRLVNVEDRNRYAEIFEKNCKKHLRSFPFERDNYFTKNLVVFSSLMKPKQFVYEEIKKIDKIPGKLDGFLSSYNIQSTSKMDLVFFSEAALNCIKIVRILHQSRGNALLVGVGGCGKQSLTKLAATIANYDVFEIKMKQKFVLEDFREDLQLLYRMTGIKNNRMVFLLTDNHIVDEVFLEDINNILNSGEVPNLYPPEEKEQIINSLRVTAREENVPETREEIYKFFIERVRNNLHIVLCLSPIGDKFRTRCRMFPSLVNCCSIIWFDSWTNEAVHSVAKRKFEKIKFKWESIESRDKMIEMSVFVYKEVMKNCEKFYQEFKRRFYVTPAKFLQFLQKFSELLITKQKELVAEMRKLKMGLGILSKTNDEVLQMQRELKELKPILLKKTKTAQEMREKIEKAQMAAEDKQKVIRKEKKDVSIKTKKAIELATLAKRALDKALPDLRRAKQALGGLTKSSIAEIKNYSSPPPAVDVVLKACQILYGSKGDNISFGEGVKLLSSSGFVNKCKNFDVRDLTEKIVNTLKKKIFVDPLFNRDEVKKQSQAAEILCVWIRAVVKFHDVNQLVIPLKKKKEIAEEELKKMKDELRNKQEAVREIERKLDGLNKAFQKNSLEIKDLSDKTDTCKRRLEAANQLINSLGDEQKTWTKTLKSIKGNSGNLAGNILLSSASIVFFGPFTSIYRRSIFKKWVEECANLKIPLSKENSLVDIMGEKVTIRDWVISKLPSDQQSIENAIITFNSNQFALMIDPQSQGNTWIKTLEKKNVKTMYMRNNFIRDLKSAIGVGTPVVLENVGEMLDPSIDPYLDKQLSRIQGRTLLNIGKEQITYSENFRLFLTTKISNPHYLPDICNKTSLINFMVTKQGLEDQLLSEVVQRLERELEESRDKLIIKMARSEKTLKTLRNKILSSLSSVGNRNILDDEKIIKTLDESKFSQNVVEQSYSETKKQEKYINEARKKYRSLAVRGSILYFVISKFANIDPMYEYSLEYFKELFNTVIENTLKKEKDLAKGGERTKSETENLLKVLIDNITKTIYNNISRGLFEKDKLVLSFLFATSILKHEQKISDDEYDFFLRGVPDLKQKSPVIFIEDANWGLLCNLEKKVFGFKGITESVKGNAIEWENYITNMKTMEDKMPTWGKQKKDVKVVADFSKLLVIKCLIEEKLVFSMKEFIAKNIGTSFIKSVPLNLKEAVANCKPYTPIIFIMSTGADPTEIIKKFAREEGFSSKILIKSLGQGQEESAKRFITKGKSTGLWVMLQNCHLAISFMPHLEAIISDLQNNRNTVHPNFRLWLTSMPTKEFPVQILQNGIKITLELPKGIKANLNRSYNAMERNYFESFKEDEYFTDETTLWGSQKMPKHIAFKRLLFGLNVFNAVINERKKFGPCGWTKVYDFNDADLQVAQLWLKIFLKEQSSIPWKSLRYVIGEIVYGGRVTDPFDSRLILDILDQYITPEILRTSYKWGKDDMYQIPSKMSFDSIKEHVTNSLTEYDPPDIFKMHENADMVYQLHESKKYLSTLQIASPKNLGSNLDNGLRAEDIIKQKINKILTLLPSELSKEEGGKDTFKMNEKTGTIHSLSTVLIHELQRFNTLLRTIKSSLTELLRALDGLVVLSSKLEHLLSEILNGKLPKLWRDVGYPSLKGLDSWMEDLINRINFIRKWLRSGVPSVFWISGFFFPQGFLTGVLQSHARKYKIPIDTLSFSFKVLEKSPEEIKKGPDDGVFVSGLFLDGAKWNAKERVIEEPSRGKMINPFPVIHFLPIQNHSRDEKLYECPLYKTSERKGSLSSWGCSTNFVCSVDLPTKKKPSFWTLQGLAMCCQTDK